MIQGAQSGTGGLGLAPQKKKQDATAEKRTEVFCAFEDITEEQRYIHSLSLELFSEWIKWDDVLATDLQWTRWIMSGEDDLLRFDLATTEDVLPTPCSSAGKKSHMQAAICAVTRTVHYDTSSVAVTLH